MIRFRPLRRPAALALLAVAGLHLLGAGSARAQWVRVTFPACTGSGCAPTDGFFAGPGWAIAADDDRSYVGGGIEGAFVASTDGGATWTERRYTFDPLSADTRVFATVDSGRAYAWMSSLAGEGVHTSTDGLTWTLTGTPYTSGSVRYVGLRRHRGALFARSFSSAGRKLWRSTDLGQSWTDVTGTLDGPRLSEVLGSAGAHVFVVVLNPTTGVPSIWSSSNDGTTWTQRSADFPSAGNGVLFGRYDTGGGLARVGAATLVTYSTTQQQGAAFVTSQLRRSTDGGASFAPVALPRLAAGGDAGYVQSFAVVDAQTVLANTVEAIFLSRDAGATWTKVDERAGTNNNGFVGTVHTDGRTLYYRNPDYVERRPLADFGITTAADGPGAAVGLHLEAPAPNPARGHVRLRFSAPAPGTVRLAVYDLLGREVAVLHDGPVAAEGVAALAADRLAPGAYVVRLTGGGASVAQRLVVTR